MSSVLLVASALAVAACGGGNNITGPTPPSPDAAGPISLAVGEVRTISAADATALRITGAEGGADFVLIPFNGSLTPSSTVALEFSAEQVRPAVGSRETQVGDLTAELALAPGARRAASPSRFEMHLRRAEKRELESRIPAARATYTASRPSLTSTAAALPSVGATMAFNGSATASCATQRMRAGHVVAVTQRAIIVVDDRNPADGFTEADYASIGEEFDTHAQPLVTQNFGTPTDLDQNGGRVILFFSRIVNELTPSGAPGIVFGFFSARDLFRKSGAGACPASNEAEILYVMVPDPAGDVNGNQRSTAFVRRIIGGVLAHEYQHLVNAARRMYVNSANGFEEMWLNEGLSTITEELMFYRVAGVSPRGNMTFESLLSPASRTTAVNAYQVGNFNRLVEYLRNPEVESPFDDTDDLATRGATWQFLRYAADRSGKPEQAVWNSLANGKTTGAANFKAAFGVDLLTLVRDWATAQYTDDAVAAAAVTFQQPSWNYRSILPTLVTNKVYPLATRSLVGAPVTLTLRGGGVSYLRFGVASGATGTVRVTSSGGPVPPAVALTIVRTR